MFGSRWRLLVEATPCPPLPSGAEAHRVSSELGHKLGPWRASCTSFMLASTAQRGWILPHVDAGGVQFTTETATFDDAKLLNHPSGFAVRVALVPAGYADGMSPRAHLSSSFHFLRNRDAPCASVTLVNLRG